MALRIYDVPDPQASFSDDGDFTNPLALTFNGTEGGVQKQKLYVRNDAVGVNYTGITVTPVDGGDDLVDGSAGYSWKLFAGDDEPLEEQWAGVSAGNAISLSNISDTSTYLPFWVRVEVPAGASINSYQSVELRVNATAS